MRETRITTYEELKTWMAERGRLGSRPGLERIQELLKELGNPEQKVPAFHIAGTNGKGSVMAFLQQGLMNHGLKAGRYLSPAVFDEREKWQINGEWISKERLLRLMQEILAAEARRRHAAEDPATQFEIETAAAFLYFAEEHCDVMLIECGMGGREDATNVLGKDAVNILSSVSLDHMKFLGNTVAEITRQKLGIVRDGGKLVTCPLKPEAEAEVSRYVKDHDILWFRTEPDQIEVQEETPFFSRFCYRGKTYQTSSGGGYQIANAAAAVEVMRNLPELTSDWGTPFKLSEEEIQRGISEMKWPGRFTVVSQSPMFIVDGAHNEDAWIRLKDSLQKYFPGKKIDFILGVFRDKEYQKMADILSPMAEKVQTVTPDGPRGLSGDVLAELMQKKGIPARSFPSVQQAVADAAKSSTPQSVVVACGSLSFLKKAMQAGEAAFFQTGFPDMERVQRILANPVFQDSLRKVEEKEKNRKYCGHGLDHLLATARIGELLVYMNHLNIRPDVIYGMALLHDLGRAEGTEDHRITGSHTASGILKSAGYQEQEVQDICHAILSHGNPPDASTDLLSRILYTADKASRNCFSCGAFEECNWPDNVKNKGIYI